MTTTASLDCLVLFDIDGTLVAGAERGLSAGVRAMDAASRAVAGRPSPFSGADYAGRTDRQIARMLLIAAGHDSPDPEEISMLIQQYVGALAKEIEKHPFRVLGQPETAIAALREHGAIVGLGTGNVRPGAQLKLTSAGIAHLFDFERGGFGEDGESRSDLLDSGRTQLDPDRNRPVVIVGDTPHDVTGAKGIGAAVVGVPFGKNKRADLENAGADAVIDTIDGNLVDIVRHILPRRQEIK